MFHNLLYESFLRKRTKPSHSEIAYVFSGDDVHEINKEEFFCTNFSFVRKFLKICVSFRYFYQDFFFRQSFKKNLKIENKRSDKHEERETKRRKLRKTFTLCRFFSPKMLFVWVRSVYMRKKRKTQNSHYAQC